MCVCVCVHEVFSKQFNLLWHKTLSMKRIHEPFASLADLSYHVISMGFRNMMFRKC